MELTPQQIAQLRKTLAFRTNPPTVGWYVRSSWRVYVYATAFFGALAAFALWIDRPIVAGFAGGALFAIYVRDFKYFSRFVEGWPLSNEITNWKRVEELVESGRHAETRATTPQ
jgi:hypothetical protein